MTNLKEKDYIDTFTIQICEFFSDFTYNIGLTPNLLTFLGIVARIICLKYLFYPNDNPNAKLYMLIFYLIGYFFDVFDGYFARKYEMYSKFGDWFDHTSDNIFFYIILYYIIFQSNIRYSKYIYLYIAIFAFLQLFSHAFSGCSEKLYKCNLDSCSKSLELYKNLCVEKYQSFIVKYGKIFGLGFTNMYKAFLLYLY